MHETEHLGGRTKYIESVTSKDATMLSRIFDTAANPRAKRFRDYLCTWQYYALSPEAMRGSHHRPNEVVLNTGGDNLASVLYRLKTSDERRYRQLLRHLQRIEPSVEVINFHVFGENNVFMLFEDSQGHPLIARNASAGTLRYLALLYIVLAQPPTVTEQVVVIEEPENGLHVSLLKELVELVENSHARPQVIFTSHAPYFIDLFDDRLENVYLLKRVEGHSTLTRPDADTVKARLDKLPLGEQHFQGVLG